MADQPAGAAAMQPGQSVVAPPTQGASSFAITLNANEFLLSIGHSRVTFVDQAGVPTPVPVIEWFMTLAVSPTAVSQLSMALQAGIASYEKQFGKIPVDPNLKMNIEQPKKP